MHQPSGYADGAGMSAMAELDAAIAAARPLMRDLEPHVASALEEADSELRQALRGLHRADATPLYDVPAYLREIARLVGDAQGKLTLILAGELEASHG